MDKQYIYKLEIEECLDYKIIDVGLVFEEDQEEISENNFIYNKKHKVGYYIVKKKVDNLITIHLKLNKTLSNNGYCKLNLTTEYLNQYASKLVCSSITISGEDIDNGLHKITKIMEVDNPSEYIMNDDDYN